MPTRRAEARCRYYTREEASRLGWNVKHPEVGGAFLEEQELVDFFPHLRASLGAERPDFSIVFEKQPSAVIECKNDFNRLAQAIDEAKRYASTINSTNGFAVNVAIGVAGTPDTRVVTRCEFKKNGKWKPLESHGYPLTQIPSPEELRIAIENNDATTDVQLPDEREFFDAAIKISNILRLARIEESVRPKVIGAVILALYQGEFSFHPEVVIEQINSNIQAAAHGFQDVPHTNREALARTLTLSTESHPLRPVVADIVSQLERLNIRSIVRSGVDFLGEFYEAFLRYGCDARSMGIVFTPRHITRYCAELVNIGVGMSVYDPACGTGGFLVAAFDKMMSQATTPKAREKVKKSLAGCDTNPTVWSLAVLNMFFRGDGKSQIHFKSCFDHPLVDDGSFSRVLLNPPFSQEGEPEVNFIDHALQKLEPGGILAVVVKTAVVTHQDLSNWRKRLHEEHQVLAVLSLPAELFYPTAAPTVVIVVKAHTPNRETGVFLAKIKNDGFKISKKRRVPTEGSELQHILNLYREFEASGSITNSPGTACVIEKDKIKEGEELCAERWLPSAPFDKLKFESHRNEIVRQICLAMAKNPELVDELIEDFDEILASASYKDRPKTRATIGDWFDVSTGLSKANLPGGPIPYLSSSTDFNSIVDFVQPPDNELIDEPVISVTGFGKAYLQPWKFCARGFAGSAVRILRPKFAMTTSELVWFAGQLNDQMWRIYYGRMISMSRLSKYAVDPPPKDLPVMSALPSRLKRFNGDVQRFCEDDPTIDIESRFIALADSWVKGRMPSSKSKILCSHPAYLQIISMGERVIPLIIERLRNQADHWFQALRQLTGENPVKATSKGNIQKMATDWINWAKAKGI